MSLGQWWAPLASLLRCWTYLLLWQILAATQSLRYCSASSDDLLTRDLAVFAVVLDRLGRAHARTICRDHR
jgi:hypothetical protein